MYFSFLSSPGNYPDAEEKEAKDMYECQIIISWPYRSGFRGEKEPLDVPKDHEERVKVMKKLAGGWAEPFRECVLSIPEQGTVVTAITLEDFVPSEGMWDNLGGRMTLVGDAAHAMTMCMPFLPSASISPILIPRKSIHAWTHLLTSVQNQSGAKARTTASPT